jgi:hypothetical protein
MTGTQRWYDSSAVVTKDGLSAGNPAPGGMEANLHALCTALVRKHRQAEAREAFKPEEACESLHEFVKSLPE